MNVSRRMKDNSEPLCSDPLGGNIKVRPPTVLIGYGERYSRAKLESPEVVAICDHLIALGVAELEHKIGEKARSVTPSESPFPVPASQGFCAGITPARVARRELPIGQSAHNVPRSQMLANFPRRHIDADCNRKSFRRCVGTQSKKTIFWEDQTLPNFSVPSTPID